MSDPDFDLLDAHLRGELEPEQREPLAQRLESEPGLRAELEAHRAAILAVERGAAAAYIAQARRRHELAKHSAKVKPLAYYRMAVAAVLFLGIVGTGLWLYISTQEQSPQAMALAYFEAPSGLPTLLGPEEDLQFAEGMVEYKLGNYAAAITQWSALPRNGEDADTLAFYLGAAHLALGEPDRAYAEFSKVSQPSLDLEARWFMALALIAQDRVEEARPLLQEVEASRGLYRAQAGKLLRSL